MKCKSKPEAAHQQEKGGSEEETEMGGLPSTGMKVQGYYVDHLQFCLWREVTVKCTRSAERVLE